MNDIDTLKKLTIATKSGKIPVLSHIKEKLSEIFLYHNKDEAYYSFERNLMIIKAVLLIMLVIMSIYYPLKFKSTGILASKPFIFAIESIVFGISAVIPFVMLVLLRKNKFTNFEILKYCIMLFIVFFVINYLLELSGFYEYSFSEQQPTIKYYAEQQYTNTEKLVHTFDISLRTIFLLIALIIFIMLFIAVFFIHDTQIGYNIKGNKWLIFFIETLLFGVISAVPVYLIAKNRKAFNPRKTSDEFVIIVLKFMLLNVVLQLSGFYNHVFVSNYSYDQNYL